MRHKLLINAGWGALGESVVRISKLLQVVLISRILGPENLGLYSYGVALVGLFSVFFDFGVLPVAVKMLVQNPQSPTFRICALIKLITSLVGLLLLGLVIIFFSKVTQLEGKIAFGIGVYLALTDLGAFVVAAYRARGEFWHEARYRGLTAIFQLVACLTVLVMDHSLETVVWVMIIFSLLSIVPLALEWIKQPAISDNPLHVNYMNRVLHACLPVAGSILAGSFYMNFDTTILANYVSFEQVGWYGVAVKFSFGLLIVPLFYLLAASFSSFAHEMTVLNEGEVVARWMRGFVLSTTVGALLCVLMASLAEPLILILFGPSYVQATPVLVAFSLVGFMFYLYSPLAQWLLLQGRQKITLYIHVVATFVNALVVLAGVSLMGLWGAVLAAFITHATIALAHAWIIFRDGNFSNYYHDLVSLCRLLIGTIVVVISLLLGVEEYKEAFRLVGITLFFLVTYREIYALAETLRSRYIKYSAR